MQWSAKERARHQRYVDTYKTTRGEVCNALHNSARGKARHHQCVDTYRTIWLFKAQHTASPQATYAYSADLTRRTVNMVLHCDPMSRTLHLLLAAWTRAQKLEREHAERHLPGGVVYTAPSMI